MNASNNDSRQYSTADLERYASGNMPAAEMNALEKAALEDPFLADALEGFTNQPDKEKEGISQNLEDLRGRLEQRINPQAKSVKMFRSSWLKIAAAFIVLAGAGALVYSLLQTLTPTKSDLAKNESAAESQVRADSTTVSITDANAMKAPGLGRDSGPAATAAPERKPQRESARKGRLQPTAPPADQEERADRLSRRMPEQEMQRSQADSEMASVVTVTRERSVANNTQAAPFNTFRGQVMTTQNRPVAGASVVINKSMDVATDSNGGFNFSLPDSSAKVEVRSAGFETANAILQTDPATNEIRLRQNNQPLSENVIAGYGAQKENIQSRNLSASPSDAVPVGGWAAYDEYLGRNRKLPAVNNAVHGDVVLSFSVDSAGKPVDLRVEKGLAPAYDQEALRLLREGPGWMPQKAAKARTTIIVKF